MELFTEAEKLLMDDMPILPLYYLNASLLVKPNVTGMTKNANGHTLFRGRGQDLIRGRLKKPLFSVRGPKCRARTWRAAYIDV